MWHRIILSANVALLLDYILDLI